MLSFRIRSYAASIKNKGMYRSTSHKIYLFKSFFSTAMLPLAIHDIMFNFSDMYLVAIRKKQDFVETCCNAGMLTAVATVLLHNGGFCNNCTPKRCLHISVWKFVKITSLCSTWKKINFLNIILTQNHACMA